MKNYIVQSGATLTGTLADGKLKVAGIYGGDVEFDYNGIKKASLTAYSAGTAQVSTVTISGTLTAGNVVSLQLVQDLGEKNDALTDVLSQVISHTISSTDTVTTIATSIKDAINQLPFEIVATSAAGVVTLTATSPYNVFSIAEIKDDGANQAIATGTPGVAPAGITGANLIGLGIQGAVTASNYDVLEFAYEDIRTGDSIIYAGTDLVKIYIESTVATTSIEAALKATAITDVNVREYLAKLS